MKSKKKTTPKKTKKEKEFFVCGHPHSSYIDGERYATIDVLKKDLSADMDEDETLTIYKCTPVLRIKTKLVTEEIKLS